ncbi:hypothetical protein KC906_04535, partial [Candidatus Kaiserbacteria bacterium]|nr:hypothetical protein [Candidatus Kaiserbacteria bacterium]
MIWVLIGAFVYFNNFYTGPSCLDGRFNGTEDGVDCGGACVQICPAQVLPPRVVWAESFKIADGQYNVVAYVENPNQTAATPELHYTFTLKSGGAVVAERAGTTILPPNSVYPIFEGRVFTDGDADIDETLVLLDTPDLWLPASTGRDQFRASDIKLTNADERPRLDVDLENTDLRTAENVEVVATIFNERGEPVTASLTLVDKFEARHTKEIVFTWSSFIAKTAKSCILSTD